MKYFLNIVYAAIASLMFAGCVTDSVTMRKSQVIDEYLAWHNEILGSKSREIDFVDVKKFIADDATFIVNDKVVAKNVQEFFDTYKRMDANGNRTYFKLPVTEKVVRDDIIILRYNAELVKPNLPKENHQIFGYAQFDAHNKITRFVEIFH